jgi:peroxiredoxin (alkyl hydroperoxide reductase subunit C)
MIFPEEYIDYEMAAVIDGSIKSLKISEIESNIIILVFYPLDFTFVCPTEIRKLSEMQQEFLDECASILFISGDSVYSHLAWTNFPDGIPDVKWPMISDMGFKLSGQFNLYNEKTGTVMRGTVILNKHRKVVHISANIDPIGRSSIELLRLVKAYRYYLEHGNICPVDFNSAEK